MSDGTKSKRNGHIDFYRVIFAFTVVSHHAKYLDGRYEGDITHFVPFLGGYTAVEFFFILSGYLLAKGIYERPACTDIKKIGEETLRQVMKKVYAIYPMFILSYVLSFFVREFAFREDMPAVVNHFWASISELTLVRMIGFSFQPFEFVGPMWYVTALLVAIMVLYPLMARFREFFLTCIAPLLALSIYAYIFTTIGLVGGISHIEGCLRAIAGVALGSIVYRLTNLYSLRLRKTGKYLAVFLEIGITLLILYLENSYNTDYHDVLETALYAVLIYLSFAVETSLNCILEPFSSLFGKFSLSLYVSHSALLWVRWSELHLSWRYVYLLWMLSTSVLAVYVLAVSEWIVPQLKKCAARLKKLLMVEV